VGHAVSLAGYSKWLEDTSEMCFSFPQAEWRYVSFFLTLLECILKCYNRDRLLFFRETLLSIKCVQNINRYFMGAALLFLFCPLPAEVALAFPRV